jgi:signal transduction histidine kinase
MKTPTDAGPAAPARPPRGSRVATAALIIAFVGVLAGLTASDRAFVAVADTRAQLEVLRVAVQRDSALRARVAGADTLTAAAARARLLADSAAKARDVSARRLPPGLRLAIWGSGLTALAAVAIGLAHERRLARRIAERSAELERLSAELIRVNRAKSEFLANVSHELRTPLNAIVGFVEMLHDGVYGELAPRQVNPVQRVAASATHLRQLVDQILDLAKIAAGRLEVHAEPLDLRPFVLDVATEIEPLVAEKGLALSLGVPASLPKLRTDSTHLRQILVNLLGNAVKFTHQGGIAIRATLVDRNAPPPPDTNPGVPNGEHAAPRTAGGKAPSRRKPVSRPAAAALAAHAPDSARRWVAVQVADTGVGIAATDYDRIFDEFEQVGPRAGDSATRGTGLGLAISRRLARLLGGDLTVESVAGDGSTFTLWVPADDAGVGGAPPPPVTPS